MKTLKSRLKTGQFLRTPHTHAGLRRGRKLRERERLEGIRLDKALRLNLDGMLQLLKGAPVSYERVSAVTRLHEAIMWLGLDLKRLGEADPYPASRDPTSPVVHPASEGLRH